MSESLDPLKIEEFEKELLVRLWWLFRNSLHEFSTNIDRSIEYLSEIILPLIMASKKGRSYNPFWEIIEKYAQHILVTKLEKDGYRVLPLGYSADVTLEKEDHVLSIEVKTANIKNLSDYRRTINLGLNQTTHPAKFPVKQEKDSEEEKEYLPAPLMVYPSIPPVYELPNGTRKYVFTFGFLFIYPSYRKIVEEVTKDYKIVHSLFKKKVREILERLSISINQDENSKEPVENLIVENIVRGVFIHKLKRDELLHFLKLSDEEFDIINKFNTKILEIAQGLRENNVKPIAIITTSIPNGLLHEYYSDMFVSGKNYGKSARFHYGDGVFLIIKKKKGDEFSRILFLDVDEKYLDELRKYFPKIPTLGYGLEWR